MAPSYKSTWPNAPLRNRRDIHTMQNKSLALSPEVEALSGKVY